MAYTSITALINSIKQDVGRVGNKIAHGVAQVAFEDLQEAHQAIMDSYYDYDPVKNYHYHWVDPDGTVFDGYSHGYNRSGNLENTLQPVGVKSSGRHSFLAHVNVTSAMMHDYPGTTRMYRNGAYNGGAFPATGVFDLVWNQGIRGLPAGYVGHAGPININASPVGVGISGYPGDAMKDFVHKWGAVRGGQVADSIAFSV